MPCDTVKELFELMRKVDPKRVTLLVPRIRHRVEISGVMLCRLTEIASALSTPASVILVNEPSVRLWVRVDGNSKTDHRHCNQELGVALSEHMKQLGDKLTAMIEQKDDPPKGADVG